MSNISFQQSIARTWPRPFPTCHSLPLFNAAVHEAQINIQAPGGLIATTALASIAIVSQGLIDVLKPSGQIVPTSLMLLAVADSGERKSTADNIFLKSIRDFQKLQGDIFKGRQSLWQAKQEIWGIQKKFILKSVNKKYVEELSSDEVEQQLLAHEAVRPKKPKEFKLLYEDSTSEALFHGMHQNLSTAGLVSSEGGGILNGRAFGDFAKQNSIWSGDTITVDRKSTDSFELAGARLTVSIMTQESALQDYMKRRGGKARGSGLLARFLACYPVSTQGTRISHNGVLSWENCDKYAVRTTALLEKNLDLVHEAGRLRSVIKFTPEACDQWLFTVNAIESEISKGGRLEGAGDHASKLADNIARVAALFHFFEGFDGDISLETLVAATNICKWYSDEFIMMFVPPADHILDSADLSRWFNMLMCRGRRYIRKTHVLQYGPNRLRDKRLLDAALEALCSQHVISILDWGKGVVIDLKPGLPFDSYAVQYVNTWRM